MKKILIMLIVLVSSSLLIACNHNTAPELHGVKDQVVSVGSVFNPLAGVTATDAQDGDLTASIKVDSNVDTSAIGEYVVKYSVSDSKGLEAAAEAKVEVSNLPVISGAVNVSVAYSEASAFNALDGVTAVDSDQKDITASIVVSGSVGSATGEYTLVYTVTDAEGLSASVNRVVTVVPDYAEGVYNFKFATSDTKNPLFAAAEKYLLDGMLGGIPIYVAQSMSLLASRVSLPVDTYIPSYGWGTSLADITLDDSQIKLTNGLPGNPNEYTYRDFNTQDFNTLNFWVYDDSVSAGYLGNIEGGFYRMTLNDARNGWTWANDLALGDPVPFGATYKVVNGKDTSKSWRIELRHDLKWSFNSAINTTGFDLNLDANDFYWTYREALTQNLFRAISGGGDFASEVAGAQAYAQLAASLKTKYINHTLSPEEQAELDSAWNAVGIKKVGDYTLEFTFKNSQSTFDFRYLAGWPAMNQDLWAKYGPSGTVEDNTYGSDELHVASSGLYIISYYESDKLTRFVKNPNCPYASTTKWTGEEVIILESQEIAFNEFLDGKLETCGIPNSRIAEFIQDPRRLESPDSTTWRYNINGFGTLAAAKEVFPDTTFVPEPILSYTDFKQALYWSLDRLDLQENWVPTRGQAVGYFSGAYYVDPESGIPYRNSEEAQAVADAYGYDSRGYNLDAALWYFHEALLQGIADGYYTAGTAANPTVIAIDVRVMQYTESEAIRKTADWTKACWEKLIDPALNIKIEISITDTAFPDIYYDYQMVANCDIAIGGISGSALNASSFLDVFCSDNRGGFTINWGFDTSVVEIAVEYDYDFGNGVEHRVELWSYDALVEALDGKVTVHEGSEVPPVIDPGTYDLAGLQAELEDFLPYIYNVEFPEGIYELFEDESALGGFWVVLPEGTTLENVIDYLSPAKFTVAVYGDGTWCAEFTDGDAYILCTLLENSDVVPVSAVVGSYGGEWPEDADGNTLPALYFY
ncbi:MAG: DUF5011 domain-containing protein [Acholeplasmatales bacterium]|jgi:ABC-type oligopeptide transport system substrate-binding subunit|nr:DUF5011 domain-containing protein [Acholeplasmatales bacterium]